MHTYTYTRTTGRLDWPASDGWVVPRLKRLLRIVGSAAAPVRNITVRGVGFRDTTYTYLDDWGVPSGGDWALHRGGKQRTSSHARTHARMHDARTHMVPGAMFVEGAEDVVVERCECVCVRAHVCV